ncbi:MAG: hypothetical protein Q8O67_21660 [Deltaproteobacteria bacterium]|nr:hypothetical protein [Deltaproteobacteria bacterium]
MITANLGIFAVTQRPDELENHLRAERFPAFLASTASGVVASSSDQPAARNPDRVSRPVLVDLVLFLLY